MVFTNDMRLWRKLSITGLIGVVVYILFIIVGSFLWRGYNHITQTISELTGFGVPGANINLLFSMISGGLQIVFACTVLIIFRLQKLKSLVIIGALLLLLTEIASFVSLCIVRLQLLEPLIAPDNIMHLVTTGIMLICSVGSSFCIGFGLRKAADYNTIGSFTLCCAVIIAIFGLLLPVSMFGQLFITGLIERIHTLTLEAWIAVISIYLYRKIDLKQRPILSGE